MKGFTKAQNAVVFDGRLSMGARLTHTALLHLAWRAGRENDGDGVALPSLDEISSLLGSSRTAVKGYVAELREHGLVVTVRVRNRGMRYHVYEIAADGDAEIAARRSRAECDPELGRNATQTRGASIEEKNIVEDSEANASERAPRLSRTDGRDIALDALADVVGADTRGGRIPEMTAALNDRGSQPGIRSQFWTECVRYAEEHDATGDLPRARAEFENILARAIRRKASLYERRMPEGTMLTPSALRKWWLDLERMPDRGGMSPAEIEALDDE